jgi:hypothetical protein
MQHAGIGRIMLCAMQRSARFEEALKASLAIADWPPSESQRGCYWASLTQGLRREGCIQKQSCGVNVDSGPGSGVAAKDARPGCIVTASKCLQRCVRAMRGGRVPHRTPSRTQLLHHLVAAASARLGSSGCAMKRSCPASLSKGKGE